MITEQALKEAIAECNGKRNPDANTCLKLAAYYTIRDHMGVEVPMIEKPTYSYASEPAEPEQWEGDSEFARSIRELPISYIMPIIDELMETIKVLNPRLYNGVMRRLRGE